MELPVRRSPKGRTPHGGYDLIAYDLNGVTPDRILVQLKQYRRPVPRQFVDELRGALLRQEAQHGLIIATHTFSRAARDAATWTSLAPIRLVCGEELLDLLILHRVGVRYGHGPHWRIDRTYFADLRARFGAGRLPLLSARQWARSAATRSFLASHNRTPRGGGMRWDTHLLAGLSSLWLLQPLPIGLAGNQFILGLALAGVGSLLPDLDSMNARLSRFETAEIRPLAPAARSAARIWGHRGLLHAPSALLTIAAATLPIALLLHTLVPVALALGYASHLLLDSLTPAGIPGLKTRSRLHLLPTGRRIPTGSLVEELVLALLAASVLLFLLLHLVSP